MSSHREAPAISKDPCADNTDTYCYRTPGDTVTIITNYLPSQAPAGGPNFYEFSDDVVYTINIDNTGDGKPNIVYEFRFETVNTNPNTFLYNTGVIDKLDSANWNRRQSYTVTKIVRGDRSTIARRVPCPPCNVGPRSTPNYEAALASKAVAPLRGGGQVFCGQRADAFFVDLGSVFDLGALRPIQSLHLIPMTNDQGVDTLAQANVHTIAIQVPITHLTRNGRVPSDPMDSRATIGVWGAAYRQRAGVRDGNYGWSNRGVGSWRQVSRLGNPLFNEVIVPLDRKDEWNSASPEFDKNFAQYVAQPELGKLLPFLYPQQFPNLKALTADRKDLLAILLTGIPQGVIPGFQNFTGPTQADMLRLNLAYQPAPQPNRLGLLGGDTAGFPNGRRLTDDIVTIELRAVAGAVYNRIDPNFKPDGAIGAVEDGTFNRPGRVLLNRFPYIGTPFAGFDVP